MTEKCGFNVLIIEEPLEIANLLPFRDLVYLDRCAQFVFKWRHGILKLDVSVMRRFPKLQGLLVPIITPMYEDGSLDLEGIQRLADAFLKSSAVDGIAEMDIKRKLFNI